MPLTPEQKEFADNYKKSFWRWRENQDEDDMISVLARLVSPSTLADIIKDLEPYFASAEAERVDEFEVSIRKQAENLPDGHDMKTAVDGVSENP